MNDESLKQLLEQADMCSTLPDIDTQCLSIAVRHKFRRQQQIRRRAVAACAAIVITTLFYGEHVYQVHQKQQQIGSMQQQIQQLAQQTEATLKLVDEILAQQKQQDKLAALNCQLAAYTDSSESVQTEVNEAASILMFQADQLMKQSDRKDAAIEGYRRIIEYFPQTTAAQAAQQRLQQIQQTQTNSI